MTEHLIRVFRLGSAELKEKLGIEDPDLALTTITIEGHKEDRVIVIVFSKIVPR